MEKFIVNNLKDTKKLAKKFAKELKGGEVVLLDGDLGAGKTTFTKFVLGFLGVKGDVTSPTFTIMREYDGKRLKIYHFDMYRMTSGVEAREFGLEDYVYSKNKNAVVFMEWPNNVKDILIGSFIKIEIKNLGENSREFVISRG